MGVCILPLREMIAVAVPRRASAWWPGSWRARSGRRAVRAVKDQAGGDIEAVDADTIVARFTPDDPRAGPRRGLCP